MIDQYGAHHPTAWAHNVHREVEALEAAGYRLTLKRTTTETGNRAMQLLIVRHKGTNELAFSTVETTRHACINAAYWQLVVLQGVDK
jgi:hypothetical protein